MSTNAKTLLTPEQYLEIERKAEFRHEYFRGEMFAMAGGTGTHTIIVVNLVREMSNQLRRGRCQVYSHDMRLQVSATGLYTYPDVVVACEGRQFRDARKDTLLNPTVIIEVLSESTEAYDRGKKFAHYQTLDSLQGYVLVSQDRVRMERFLRQPDGQWLLKVASHIDDSVLLDSIGCTLRLADIYENVELILEEGPLPQEAPGASQS
jgi:Uma2 family endonuclease